MFTGGNPVLLGGGVDLEDMGPRTEDRLLSAEERERASGRVRIYTGIKLTTLSHAKEKCWECVRAEVGERHTHSLQRSRQTSIIHTLLQRTALAMTGRGKHTHTHTLQFQYGCAFSSIQMDLN